MKRLLLLALTVLVALTASAQKSKKFVHATLIPPTVEPRIIAVETASSSLILSVRENGSVFQLHFGTKVNETEFAAIPSYAGRYGNGAPAYPATGGRFLGEPALHLRYADGTHNTELHYIGHETTDAAGVRTTTVRLLDYVTKLRVDLVYEAYPEEDVILTHTRIYNAGDKPVTLLSYASGAMTFTSDRYLLTHVNGSWAQEMQVESELLTHHLKVLEDRRGVQNTQLGNPAFLLSLGTSELSETEGEVIAGALAWSGNWRLSFERDAENRLTVLGGISPFASEYPLKADASFRTPDMIWTYSDKGAGQASRNLHRWARRYGVYGGDWDALPDEIVEGPEHLALSRKMAEESLVLLHNNGILPLSDGTRVALIGPNADDREMQWGNYNPIPEKTVTLADALRERIPDLTLIRGCGLVDSLENDLLWRLRGNDIVVFAGGISPRIEGEEMPVDLPGFRGGDRTDIEFPAVQRSLIRRLQAAGKRVILVNFSGSAMGLETETLTCEAILQAWYPGEEGGQAIADVLFGDVNPSGKLPVTFYRHTADIPDYEDYAMEGRTYRYFRGSPLFPFGFGLSYSRFTYGEARVESGRLIVPVTNESTVDGTEVVQLYVRDPEDTDGPLKTLRGFCRVTVPAGETVEASIPLTDETFLAWSEAEGDMVPKHGRWELLYGGSSDALRVLAYEYQ